MDVVPASAADPHGAAFTSMVLPVVMSSLIGGVLLTIKLPHLRERALGILLFALGGGACVTLIASHTLGFLPGSFLPVAASIAAPILAISAFSTGTASLIGRYGFAVAGSIMMLLSPRARRRARRTCRSRRSCRSRCPCRGIGGLVP